MQRSELFRLASFNANLEADRGEMKEGNLLRTNRGPAPVGDFIQDRDLTPRLTSRTVRRRSARGFTRGVAKHAD